MEVPFLEIEKKETKQVSSMIHSARRTASPVANIVFALNSLCFARFWKVGMDGWTEDMCENNDPYRPWLWVGRVDQIEEMAGKL